MRYRSAFEASSSIGFLTEVLALRCDRLLWNDLTPFVLCVLAFTRTPGQSATSKRGTISNQWPSGDFDLVVLNEVMARLDDKDLGSLVDCVVRSTSWGAHVVDVRARSPSRLSARPRRQALPHRREPAVGRACPPHRRRFVLDVWERW